MIETTLPNGRKTDRLAFGCAGIGGSLDYPASRKLLIAAWEAGFRHFDTAQSYGMGMSEAYIGRFIREVGCNDATIATKVGIAKPPAIAGSKRLILSVARPLLNRFPSVRRSLGDHLRKGAVRGQFSAEFVERSLHDSLKALKVDHIDVYLMHEMTSHGLSDELKLVLQRAKAAGKIGCVGVGANRQNLSSLEGSECEIFDFFQTNWEWDHPILPRPTKGTSNCYSVLRALARLDAELESSDRRRDIEDKLDLDLRNPLARVDLILSMALYDTQNGLVIAQSKSPQRIKDIRVDMHVNDVRKLGEVANEIFRRK
jgi:hypothetical protein